MAVPETLSATGAFADLPSLTPNPGIVPYELNVSFWSDGAQKQRWFSLPNLSQTIGFNAEGNWSLPAGAVWIKHFELTNAVNAPVRRLETRLLVKTETGVYGVTYRWGDSTTNAILVPPEGLDEPIAIRDAGIVRTQVWRYPSQRECLACHTPSAGYALGFNTAQLNRDGSPLFNSGRNQIKSLSEAGYFQTSVSNIHTFPALADLSNAAASREFRVRSYLAVNCAPCHQPGGSGYGSWDARASTPLREAGLINGTLFSSRGDPANRVVAPGAPEHSMLLTRIAELGSDRMPPIASRELDLAAIELLRAWITNDLPARTTFTDWQLANFGSTNTPVAAPDADPDGDGAINRLEFLAWRNPSDPADPWRIGIQRTNGFVDLLVTQPANRLMQLQFTDKLAEPAWQPLDAPGNRPFPSASNVVRIMRDITTNSSGRLFRAILSEP
jgi:mono/diheme cytochrome c family protein